jgi:hypothetical protein
MSLICKSCKLHQDRCSFHTYDKIYSYTDHNKRAAGWTVDNFTTEYAEVRTEILNDATLENKQFLIGPSVCCDKVGFELDDVFATGWLDQEKDNLAYVAVQQYVNISCDSGWP